MLESDRMSEFVRDRFQEIPVAFADRPRYPGRNMHISGETVDARIVRVGEISRVVMADSNLRVEVSAVRRVRGWRTGVLHLNKVQRGIGGP